MDSKYWIYFRRNNILEHKKKGYIYEMELNTYPQKLEQEEITIESIKYRIIKQEYKFVTGLNGVKNAILYVFVTPWQ